MFPSPCLRPLRVALLAGLTTIGLSACGPSRLGRELAGTFEAGCLRAAQQPETEFVLQRLLYREVAHHGVPNRIEHLFEVTRVKPGPAILRVAEENAGREDGEEVLRLVRARGVDPQATTRTPDVRARAVELAEVVAALRELKGKPEEIAACERRVTNELPWGIDPFGDNAFLQAPHRWSVRDPVAKLTDDVLKLCKAPLEAAFARAVGVPVEVVSFSRVLPFLERPGWTLQGGEVFGLDRRLLGKRVATLSSKGGKIGLLLEPGGELTAWRGGKAIRAGLQRYVPEVEAVLMRPSASSATWTICSPTGAYLLEGIHEWVALPEGLSLALVRLDGGWGPITTGGARVGESLYPTREAAVGALREALLKDLSVRRRTGLRECVINGQRLLVLAATAEGEAGVARAALDVSRALLKRYGSVPVLGLAGSLKPPLRTKLLASLGWNTEQVRASQALVERFAPVLSAVARSDASALREHLPALLQGYADHRERDEQLLPGEATEHRLRPVERWAWEVEVPPLLRACLHHVGWLLEEDAFAGLVEALTPEQLLWLQASGGKYQQRVRRTLRQRWLERHYAEAGPLLSVSREASPSLGLQDHPLLAARFVRRKDGAAVFLSEARAAAPFSRDEHSPADYRRLLLELHGRKFLTKPLIHSLSPAWLIGPLEALAKANANYRHYEELARALRDAAEVNQVATIFDRDSLQLDLSAQLRRLARKTLKELSPGGDPAVTHLRRVCAEVCARAAPTPDRFNDARTLAAAINDDAPDALGPELRALGGDELVVQVGVRLHAATQRYCSEASAGDQRSATERDRLARIAEERRRAREAAAAAVAAEYSSWCQAQQSAYVRPRPTGGDSDGWADYEAKLDRSLGLGRETWNDWVRNGNSLKWTSVPR